MPIFKPGLKVKCLDARGCHTIYVGNVYEVTHVKGDSIKIVGSGSWLCASRFTCHSPLSFHGVSKGDLIHCGNSSTVYKVRYVDHDTQSVIGVSTNNQGLYEIPFDKVRRYDPDGVAVIKFVEGFNTQKAYYFKLEKGAVLSSGDIVKMSGYGNTLARVINVYREPTPCQNAQATKYLRAMVMENGYAI